MSGDEVNPAAEPQPVEDIQGDGRWISQVLLCMLPCGHFLEFSNSTLDAFPLTQFTPQTSFLVEIVGVSSLHNISLNAPTLHSDGIFVPFSDCLVRLSLWKVNPAQLMRLKQSAGVQALHQMGHQTNLIELKGFLSQ